MNETCSSRIRAPLAMAALILAVLALTSGPAEAQTPKVKIDTLGAPSSSVWMVTVLQAKRFDLKNGIDIEWAEQPSTAAVYNDFAAGSYPVATGGVLSYANQYARGVNLKLFATYQIFGTSVIVNTERAPNIRSLKDLNGTGCWAGSRRPILPRPIRSCSRGFITG